jgi:replicative DNA helicase
MPKTIIFSEIQQQAILGHAIYKSDIFDTLDSIKVTGDWFATEALAQFWEHIKSFRKTFNNCPTSWEELLESINDDETVKTAATRVAAKCEAAVNQHKWEVLEKKLLEWSKASILNARLEEIVEAYNNNKPDKAFSLLHDCSSDLIKAESIVGVSYDSFQSCADRVKGEKEARLKEVERILPYGITYFQHSLNGILPSDVVLIGADSGAGKTEAAKILSCHIAKEKQLPVHYFALEAENLEMERRIKYGIMGDMYRKNHSNIPEGMICYKNYRFNLLDNEFAPYESHAQAIFEKDYRNLHITYGCKTPNGGLGPKDLEKAVYKIKDDTALVVIDHLHYVDLGENETRDMTILVKNIRTMSLRFNIPFILVCHIKKKDKKFSDLIPDKDDYHGSSNIFKVATQAIMLARARNYMSTDTRAWGNATLFRTTKARVDGSAVYNTGVGFFDYYKNEYTKYYSCGHLSPRGDKWLPNSEKMPYWVHEDCLIRDCSEVE